MKSFDAIKGAPSRSWWCRNGQSWDQQPVFSGDNRKRTDEGRVWHADRVCSGSAHDLGVDPPWSELELGAPQALLSTPLIKLYIHW